MNKIVKINAAQNISDVLMSTFIQHSEVLSVQSGNEKPLTFRHVSRKAYSVLNYLTIDGFMMNDTVLFLIQDKHLEWLFAEISVILGGGIVSFLDSKRPVNDWIACAKKIRPKYIFIEDEAQMHTLLAHKADLEFVKRVILRQGESISEWVAPFEWMFTLPTEAVLIGRVHEQREAKERNDLAYILFQNPLNLEAERVLHRDILLYVEHLETDIPALQTAKTVLCVFPTEFIMQYIGLRYLRMYLGKIVSYATSVDINSSLLLSYNADLICMSEADLVQLKNSMWESISTKSAQKNTIETALKVLDLERSEEKVPFLMGIKQKYYQRYSFPKIRPMHYPHLKTILVIGAIQPDIQYFFDVLGIELLSLKL